jgi:hypothetical protein
MKCAYLIGPRANVADAWIVRDDRDVRSLRSREARSPEECDTQPKGSHQSAPAERDRPGCRVPPRHRRISNSKERWSKREWTEEYAVQHGRRGCMSSPAGDEERDVIAGAGVPARRPGPSSAAPDVIQESMACSNDRTASEGPLPCSDWLVLKPVVERPALNVSEHVAGRHETEPTDGKYGFGNSKAHAHARLEDCRRPSIRLQWHAEDREEQAAKKSTRRAARIAWHVEALHDDDWHLESMNDELGTNFRKGETGDTFEEGEMEMTSEQ